MCDDVIDAVVDASGGGLRRLLMGARKANGSVTDDGIRALAGTVPKLTRLDTCGLEAVSAEALSDVIATAPLLESIDVRRTGANDALLGALHGLVHLRIVYVDSEAVTPGALDALRAARPGLEVFMD